MISFNHQKNILKEILQKYYIIILCFTLYIAGYLFAYPNVIRAFIYFYYVGDALIDLLEKTLIFSVFLAFCSLLYKNKYSTRIITYLLLVLLCLNFIIPIYLRIVFNQELNTGIALSFLGTNSGEIIGVFKDYKIIFYTILSIVFFAISLSSVKKIAQINFDKKRSVFVLFSILFIVFYHFFGYQTAFYKQNKNKFRLENQTYFSNLYPIYHLNEFIVANTYINNLKKINSKQKNFSHLKSINNEIENIVLVIGESARKKNMSLYGYERKTTPMEDLEKSNMLIYENAVSPGPLTLISIPMILSAAQPDDYSFSTPKFSDNVISLANALQYDTYWLTTQKFPGEEVSLISVFENYAQKKQRIDGTYDEKILPYFNSILKNKNKKFIVLHINGSHMTYCDKYPSSEAFFKGKPNNIDCYDNSIKYTDKVLGKIFQKLKNSKSCLVYVSDHGTTFANNMMKFSNTKDQTNVPLYIWYSPTLLKEKKMPTGRIKEETQTTIVYPILSNILLGYNYINLKDQKFSKNLRFVNSDLTVVDYKNLKEKE